jgi:hypothetical protein
MTSDGPVRVTVIPTEVVRIGAMASTLLDEARHVSLDEAASRRLEEIYQRSVRELVAILPTALGAELDHIALPFEREPPTQGELRVAQAQLVGWLEGLFRGIQFALFVQQVAARSQVEELRRPAGQAAGREPVSSSGPYL